MKKILLSFLAFSLFGSSYAQNNSNVQVITKEIKASSGDETIVHEFHPVHSTNKDLMFDMIDLGSASNIYTILDVSQNQVHYNADLDIVSFTHRQNNALFPDGGSGVLRYDISTDGGTTWDIDLLLTPMLPDSNSTGGSDDGLHIETPTGTDIVYGYRYPSGLVLTPSGGTIEDSYMIAMGPTVSAPLGDPWAHTFFASRKLDGSTANNEQIFQVLNNADSGWANIDYMGRGLVKGGEDVYAISTNWNADATQNLSMYVFWKGSINDADTDLDWTYTIFYPDFKTSGGNPIINGNVGVAFNNDGSVGYMIIGGCLSDYTGDMERPVVYKTTDNGDTWNLQAELDIANTAAGTALGGYPYFRDFDVVVDANGDLHVFSETMQYSNDLATFTYEGYMAEFILSNADNTWTNRIIGDINNTASGGFFTTFQDLYTHPQAGVTADGNKVFYSWLESIDTDINDVPDVLARGIDISNNTWTQIKNLTLDTDAEGGAIYATMSPVIISDGDDFNYELPIVCVPNYAGELEETFFTYLKGIGFNGADFTAMSVNEIENDLAKIDIYPNPAQGNVKVQFDLINAAKVSMSMYNALGEKVAQLNEANLSYGSHQFEVNTNQFVDGLYFIELNVNGNSLSKKILIAH
jgi:hypothetical protein